MRQAGERCGCRLKLKLAVIAFGFVGLTEMPVTNVSVRLCDFSAVKLVPPLVETSIVPFVKPT